MRKAIDVSYHQGKIDWSAVRRSGIDAAIIRAGYRTTFDRMAKYNVKEALKNNIEIGLYWFIYVDQKSIYENAQSFIEFAREYKDGIKHKLWADWEYATDEKSPGITSELRSQMLRQFLETIEHSGFEIGIYSNMDYIKSGKFEPNLITDYPLWFARYIEAEDPGVYAKRGKELYLWQYTSKGSVHGINGNVDLNFMYEQAYKYYSIPRIKTNSIVSSLNSILVDSSYSFRKKIAEKNGIKGYYGSATQNITMLNLLINGRLEKV